MCHSVVSRISTPVENAHGRWVVSSLHIQDECGLCYECDETAVYREGGGLLGEIYVVGSSDDHYAVAERLSWDIYPSEEMLSKFAIHERDFSDAFRESARVRSERCYARDDRRWASAYKREAKPKRTK